MITVTTGRSRGDTRWRRRGWLGVLAASTLLVEGCSTSTGGYVENTYPVTKGHDNHSVAIGHGRLGTSRWTLSADQNGEGQLCLGITVTPAAGPQDYGCGFGSNQVGDEGRGTEPTNTAQTKDGRVLAYGPSPTGAVRAVLSTPGVKGTGCRASTLRSTTVAIRHRLPDWYPVRDTGWFVTEVPAAALSCVINVEFLDARGHVVRQPNNF